jgi:photosystem II stability/assembly factor-like uncharacterized protein
MLLHPWSGSRENSAMRELIFLSTLFLLPGLADTPKPDARTTRARRGFYFEENRGQLKPGMRFLARTAAGPAGLGMSSVDFPGGIRMIFDGAGRPRIEGVGRQAGTTSYFFSGSTAAGIPHFTSVTYRNLYRGIDAEFHERDGRLEWDFLVAPRADPSGLSLSFSGADRPRLDDQGNLRIGSRLSLHRPVAYQVIGGVRREVGVRYQLKRSRIRIDLAAYDRSRPLVIDPVVSWSIGGGSDVDIVTAVASDPQGHIYLAGRTSSPDLLGSNRSGGPASFVTKLDSTGSEVIYTAFLATPGAGTAVQDIWGVAALAVDQDGAACIAGRADVAGFAVRNPLPGAITAGSGGFVARLNPAGTDLTFATFLGTAAQAYGITVDSQNNIYITGATPSGFLLQAPTQASHAGGGSDAFLTKLAGDGSRVMFSTYLGGSGADTGTSVAVDPAGNIIIAGNTTSEDFPSRNPLVGAVRKPGHNPVRGFVARWTPDFQLTFSTLLGGSEYTLPHGVGSDAAGNIYIAGDSAAPDLAGATPPAALDQVLLKSEDGGVTWVSRQEGLASHSVNDVQIVSGSPQTIYAATQDAGVFHSQDNGLTWGPVNQGLTDLAVTALRLDVRNPQKILAVAASGLFQSTDGGKQWALLGSADAVANDAAIDPFDPGTIYSAHNHPLGVRKSTDAGKSWREMIPAAQWRTRTANWVLPDPANPGVIYAGGNFVPAGSSSDDIVLRSDDGGDTWNRAGSGLPPFPNRPVIAGGAIYVGFHNRSVYRSRSGGKSWEALSTGLSPTAIGGAETGYDIQSVAISEQQPDVLYLATFLSSYFPPSGVFRTENGGASWSATNLPFGYVHAVAIDPTDPKIVYAGRETGMMVFVMKIDAAATKVVYTFLTGPPITCCFYSLGGFSANLGYTGALTVSPDGTTWVTGGTGAPFFPQINPLQDAYGGAGDVYLLKLSPDGEPLISTFIGSSGMEYARAIAQAPDGSVIIGGITDSTDAPSVRLGSLTPGRGEALLIRVQP